MVQWSNSDDPEMIQAQTKHFGQGIKNLFYTREGSFKVMYGDTCVISKGSHKIILANNPPEKKQQQVKVPETKKTKKSKISNKEQEWKHKTKYNQKEESVKNMT